MKTLFERLSNNNRKKILDYSEKYPITADLLISELNSNISVIELKLDTALRVFSICFSERINSFDVNDFFKLFKE